MNELKRHYLYEYASYGLCLQGTNIVFDSLKSIVSIKIQSYLIDLLTQDYKRPFTYQ